MAENEGILFIPDISGFTRFVNASEIQHSKLIIQELLEVLINANQIGLEVSEIEGDAILFYKFGDPPPLEDLYRQVARMYTEFHQNLAEYEQNRFCWCEACKSSVDLTLKVITHYGEFTGYNVRNFNKLIGKDVIIAHQLLKNTIEPHDYWLITRNLTNNQEPKKFTDWMTWNSGTKEIETGELPFQYTHISPLKQTISKEPSIHIDYSSLVKAFSITKEYDIDLIRLFHAAGDFQYRNRWMEGIKSVEHNLPHLPRVGMKCRCMTDKGEMEICSCSYTATTNTVEFTERHEPNKAVISLVLEKITENKTKLTFNYYVPKGFPSGFLFNLFKKGKTRASMERSLEKLKEFIKEFKLPYE